MQKHERSLRKLAKVVGASVQRTSGGHYRLAGDGWLVYATGTPSDHRDMRNLMRDIRSAKRCAA